MKAKKELKIIFAGTPRFASVALSALLHEKYNIIAVYTQPDRPSGRGQKITQSEVKLLAMQHHLSIYQPVSLKNSNEQHILADLNADLMIVAAYGLILPSSVLRAVPLGCVNIHSSLLPRWRGAAPIQRAILAGDKTTGISIMQMEEGLDTGPVLYQEQCAIDSEDTSATLHDKLADLGARSILTYLDLLSENRIHPTPQDEQLVTYAHKLEKEEAKINWHLSAEELARQVRGFNPWPISFTKIKETVVRVWQAEPLMQTTKEAPGTLLQMDRSGMDVATGQGTLRLLTIQLPGGRALPVKDVLNAKREEFSVGQIFT